MNFLRKGLLTLLLAGVSTSALHAQILWSLPSTITNDLDVKTNGTYFDAAQLQRTHTTAQTVNGVVFNAFNNTTSDGTISFSGGDGTDSYSATPLSASYQAILTHTGYVGPTETGTVTIGSVAHPLTLGDTYQVEIWLGANSGRSTSYSGVTPLVLTGAQYGLGTFNANATTFSFTFTTAINSFAEIDAISVRDVPEPSVWAMMLGGFSVLAILRRGRGACIP